MATRDLPQPAAPDRVRRLKMHVPEGWTGAVELVIPPWGYLEGLEVRLAELVPNMDASIPNLCRLGIGNGYVPSHPFELHAVVRDVLEPGQLEPDPYTAAPRLGDTTLACPSCGESLRGHLELAARRPR